MEGFSMIPKTILFSHKKEKLRVAAYCRVSTNHPDQFGSLETQKAYFETIIRENPNWQFVKIYSDIGSALRTNSRPGYRQMILDGEKGLFDLVLVKSLSRFGPKFCCLPTNSALPHRSYHGGYRLVLLLTVFCFLS
jgi:site-specific DNA recombinase